ncbi:MULTISPECIES: nitrate- and nitrite sensing domain-containing protein [Nocardiopsis]|uniref:histidine kinase n=1 Tax=Nocardiopsis changdeensis TaxID=2831969 RepID=A0ABX8BR41_9ACTN|nr:MULTISPECIES: nitrate- and nitrite sensing domain-containing protein [Nocardiopsis]QUX24549.1 nitrate- and nitrite sensing domain-containing protein [Nocardiopsis changdeensis]QYX34938.1 nitrate- and nitrite sensing domain-containing protein [Nocardiopsis sp. MT53]
MGRPGGRGRGIRAQLNRIVLIPSITFLALFVLLSMATLAQAVSLRSAVAEGRAGIHLVTALTRLQEERRLAAEYLADPGSGSRRALADRARLTDEAVDTVRGLDGSLGDRDDPGTPALTEDLLASFDAVAAARTAALADPPAAGADTLEAYTSAIHRGIRLYSGTIRSLDDGGASAEAAATTDLLWAQESFSHADALVAAVAVRGDLTRDEQTRITALLHDARLRLDTVHPGDDAGAPTPAAVTRSGPWQRLLEIGAAIGSHEAPASLDPVTAEIVRDTSPPAGLADWRAEADRVNAELADLTARRAGDVVTATEAASAWMLSLALGGGITSLFAGTVAYGVAARSAGRLTRRLARLRAETLGVARVDLPRIVRRLEAGESVDPDAEIKQLDHGDDEVGQVADAFNIAQRTAVAATVKQAELRSGVNRVFLGIAHRNQSLVQRQLQLLDRIEREEDDPDLLESIFRLDHLATRGRRHAENLIILGGARPGRRWRRPIPLIDILRGAVSETEEYARVHVTAVPELSLAGAAVADVIHLLAELVENATAYSPPHTDVTISAETVPKGVAVEIEDRGLGMTEDALTRANTTLSEAPEFDVMAPGTDARLGLFVVARLAVKHDVQVELRPSPYGGTRAVVLLPGALFTAAGAAPDHSRPAARRVQHAPAQEGADAGTAVGVLVADDGAAPPRPRLRPVPPPDGHGDGAGHRAPVLRSVPDLPAPDGPHDGTPADGGPSRTADRAAAGGDRPDLPRRRRQASLAPQLRHSPAPEPGEEQAPPPSARSPEEARRMMDAFSAGTRRGRAADVDGDGRQYDSHVGGSTDDHTGEND